MPKSPQRLLMVCSGNICRSPMAEVLGRSHGDRRGLDIQVQSAGTLGIQGAPADPKAVTVCRELGLDLRGHRSQALTPELARWADHILVMELAHALWIRERVPDLREDQVLLLGSFQGLHEIDDPIGAWFTRTFRECRDLIDRCLIAYLDRHFDV